ncbi:MAG: glutamate 5-kinase [Peptococcaceae bacterium]|nr:glutamate 5-kinase [Peptococcaceae bacterium]
MGKRSSFTQFKRIVVKVGTSTLAYNTGKLNLTCMEHLTRQMADLYNEGREVILVTSGAIGAGVGKLGLHRRPKSIPEKQACAAVGQGILLHMYEKMFAEYGVVVGQVLLSREDFSDRRRFLNARNTLEALLRMGVVPLINENDTVAVEEIKLGDNDHLSALVAASIDADVLLLLSDIDGLYTADPRRDAAAAFIPEVPEITPEIEKLAGTAGSELGTGGMSTKIYAAKIATHSGVTMVIARGSEENVIRRVLAGEELGTVFWPLTRKLETRKRWIAYSAVLNGKIVIDDGAAHALLKEGKSLLPSGVTAVEGSFGAGDTVSICDASGREIARGIVNFGSDEISRIMGRRSDEIVQILGYQCNEEVVHRNNMVLEAG